MYCQKCGTELPEGVAFCTNCGASVSGESSGNGAKSASATASLDNFKQKLFAPKLSKMLTIIFLFVAAGSNLLVSVGNFGNAFMSVIGDLITLVFETALYGLIAVLLIMGKTELAKKALYPIISYWLISTILGDLSMSANIVAGANGLVIVFALFEFAIALLLITAAILFVLSLSGKAKRQNAVWILVLFVLALSALSMLFRIIFYITVGSDWTRYFTAIFECAFNFGMVFAVSAVKSE